LSNNGINIIRKIIEMKIERGWGDILAFCAEFKNSFNTIGLRSLAFTLTKHSHLFASKLEKK
jgi:hypothetical protein